MVGGTYPDVQSHVGVIVRGQVNKKTQHQENRFSHIVSLFSANVRNTRHSKNVIARRVQMLVMHLQAILAMSLDMFVFVLHQNVGDMGLAKILTFGVGPQWGG